MSSGGFKRERKSKTKSPGECWQKRRISPENSRRILKLRAKKSAGECAGGGMEQINPSDSVPRIPTRERQMRIGMMM